MTDQDTDLRAACLEAGLCDEAALDAAVALRESLAAAGETVDLLGALGRNGVLDDEKIALLRQVVPAPRAAVAAPAAVTASSGAGAPAVAPGAARQFGERRQFGAPQPTGSAAGARRGAPRSNEGRASPGRRSFGGRDAMFEPSGSIASAPLRPSFGAPPLEAPPTGVADTSHPPSAAAQARASALPSFGAAPQAPQAPPPPPETPERPAFGARPATPVAAPTLPVAATPAAPLAPPPLTRSTDSADANGTRAEPVPADLPGPAGPQSVAASLPPARALSTPPAPRDVERATRPARVRTRGSGLKVVVLLLVLLVLAAGGAAGWWFYLRPEAVTGPTPAEIAAAQRATAVAEARVALGAVDAFAAENPLEIDAIALRLDELGRAHPALPPADLGTSRARANAGYEEARENAFAAVLDAAERAAALGEPVDAVLTILAFPESMRHGDLAKHWAERYAFFVGQVVKTGMVFVPAGNVADVPHFLIDRSEVSNGQYADYVARSGTSPPSHWRDVKPPAHLRDLPVVGVTHAQAAAYAEWRGKRLPTAREWEKAAQSTEGWAYPWGNTFDPVKCVSRDSERAVLSSTSSFTGGASLYGALHMAGNAAEWTADPAPPQGATARRVVRGGSVRSDREGVRATATEEFDETTADPELFIGFRCAKSVESPR